MYNYNFTEGKYWITLDETTSNNNNNLSVSNNDSENKVNYYSSTGQFISNCFFFVEGIESEAVNKKLDSILNSKETIESIPDIKHLENQDFISSYIFKYIIQNNYCEQENILKYLIFLKNISNYLANKIGTKVEINNQRKIEDNSITRCSYKFCHFTYYCQYNYPEKQIKSNKGCYSDHYVHNKVAQDLYYLINHIENNYLETEQVVLRNNQEVIKCINTITFCIKHMYDELWNIYISSKENYENYHKNMFIV